MPNVLWMAVKEELTFSELERTWASFWTGDGSWRESDVVWNCVGEKTFDFLFSQLQGPSKKTDWVGLIVCVGCKKM